MNPITVEIRLTEGILDTSDLAALLRAVEEKVPAGGPEPTIISGRLPVWAFAALVHLFHPRPWVATFDPRLGGGVVVSRHHRDGPDLGAVVAAGDTVVEVAF